MAQSNNLRKNLSVVFLFIICGTSLALALPTIRNNIDNPNMIVYSNPDEGWLMDTTWFYYSGEKRPSFRIESEYGLLALYLSDLARVFLSKFIKFTPGIFVLLLRWIYLLSWLGAIAALWRFVGYHFKRPWQQVLCGALLATRPSFTYLLNNLKPDGLVLLLMIVGLDYTLRLIERPSLVDFTIAAVFASLAMVVKYEGPFLLPAMVAALYYAKRYNIANDAAVIEGSPLFHRMRIAYLAPLVLGAAAIGSVLGCIFFYTRASNSLTLYAEYGIIGAVRQNPYLSYAVIFGLIALSFSAVLLALRLFKSPFLVKMLDGMDEIASYAFLAAAAFLVATALFGIRWIINPRYFIMTYVPLGYSAFGMGAITMISKHGLIAAFLNNITHKLRAFDPMIFVLFVFYIGVESRYYRINIKGEKEQLFKRLVLTAFLVLPFAIIFSMVWMGRHHMLPFYAAASVLGVQGVSIFNSSFKGSRFIKKTVLTIIGILLVMDIAINAAGTMRSRLDAFKQREDVVYEIEKWFKVNIPFDASIVSAPYHYVYIPEEYKNVKVFKNFSKFDADEFRAFIDRHKPRYIYYNLAEWEEGGAPFADLSEVFPKGKIKLLRSFDSSTRLYKRMKGDRFYIYQVLWSKL